MMHINKQAALVAAAAFLSNLTALSNHFVSDDIKIIVQNPNIADWSRLGGIFTGSYWGFLNGTAGLYRPITVLSFLVERSTAGFGPALYHADNIILHAVCSVAAYLLLERLFDGHGRVPLFAALLFAAHPVHSEAVAWVSGRAELLSAAFVLSALLAGLRRPVSPLSTALSCLLFLLGLLSKESAVAMPALLFAILVLYGDGPLPARFRKAAQRVIPYIVVFAAYLPVRLHVLHGAVGPDKAVTAFQGMDLSRKLFGMAEAFTHYIRLSFLPFDLRPDYVFRPPDSVLAPSVLFLVFAVTAAVAALILFRSSRSFRPAAVAASFFFIGLLPVSNIIPVEVIMTERALYLPSLGACILLGIAFSRAGIALICTAAVAFTAGSLWRAPYWGDSARFEAEMKVYQQRRMAEYPENPDYSVKAALMALDKKEYGPETEALIRRALDTAPGYGLAHYAMAILYEARAQHEKALEEVGLSLSADPRHAESYNLKSVILDNLGRLDEAGQSLDEALRLNPYYEAALFNKGLRLKRVGRMDEAMSVFGRLSAAYPDSPDGYREQGIVLGGMGRFDESLGMLRKAESINPDDPETIYYEAAALLGLDKRTEAADRLRAALRHRPDYPEAASLLAGLTGR